MLHGTSSLTARWPFDSICRSINFRKKSPLHLHFSQREYSPVFSRSCFSLAFYRGSLGQPFSHFSISQHSACLALKLFHLLFNLLYPLARGVLFRFGLVFVCMCVYAPVASVSGSGWEVRSPRAHKSVSVSANTHARILVGANKQNVSFKIALHSFRQRHKYTSKSHSCRSIDVSTERMFGSFVNSPIAR